MRGSPSFRFHDDDSFYDRDIMHKRTASTNGDQMAISADNNEVKRTAVGTSAATDQVSDEDWEDWGEWDDFTGLMDDVSLYPPSFGLYDRTVLTRVQRDGRQAAEQGEDKTVEEEQEKRQDKEKKSFVVSEGQAEQPVVKVRFTADKYFE